MRYRGNNAFRNSEKIENLWEIRLAKDLAEPIKKIAKTQRLTFSMILRYCIFRMIEDFTVAIDNGHEIAEFLRQLPQTGIDEIKIPNRKLVQDLAKNKPFSDLNLGGIFFNTSEYNEKIAKILKKINQCYLQRGSHNQDYHRFVICFYGSDEMILRHTAASLGITVALLIRSAVELHLPEFTVSEAPSNDLILKYAIKQGFVLKFQNKAFATKNPLGSHSIHCIPFPKWKYWPIRR